MVAQGTPEQVARVKKSYTGQALTEYFKSSARNGSGKNAPEKNGSAQVRAAENVPALAASEEIA